MELILLYNVYDGLHILIKKIMNIKTKGSYYVCSKNARRPLYANIRNRVLHRLGNYEAYGEKQGGKILV